MVEPLMLLLSSINERYEYDHPVDIMYLNREDRMMVSAEADRLGRLAWDENKVMSTTDVLGQSYVDTTQVIGDCVVDINPATAALLYRVRKSYEVFVKNGQSASADIESEDIGADKVVLRLEGNPRYVYVHVYQLMLTRGMDFDTKIAKLLELYNTLTYYSMPKADNNKLKFLTGRFELQSTVQFWQSLLMHDIMRHTGSVANVAETDLETVKKELKQLGFYGFVNPLKMYQDFLNSRVNNKVGARIDDSVLDYLYRVVRSGGAEV